MGKIVMKAEPKALWVDALYCGAYKQGFPYLRTLDDRYDAVGVLCDVYAKAIRRDLWVKNKLNDCYEMHGHEVTLPYQVRQWAGFTDAECPHSTPVVEGVPIWDVILKRRLSHLETAKLIEAHFG